MTMESSSTMKSGTKLVIGLLLVAAVLLIISRVFHLPATEEGLDELQQQGVPAARYGIGLSQEGVRLLPAEEQRELGGLYGEALNFLRPEERQRFLSLAQKGAAASDQEIAESGDLIQRALRSLSPEKTERLLSLVGKAVQLQLAQQKKAAQ
jgi:hypothetical protein